MRTFVWFAYFWGYLVALVPKMRRAERCKQSDPAACEAIVNTEIPKWAKRLMRLAGAQITVTGLENIPKDKAVIFAANHQGYFDIPLLLAYLDKPHALVSKIEISKMPLIRTWMRMFDCIFIDRANPRHSVAGLNEAIRLVESGKSVGIFPEGTRAKGGPLGEFKAGVFRIAAKTRAPIVPLAISGTHNLMEANGYWIRPANVTLHILPAIDIEALDKEALKALPARVQESIAAALNEHI
ncbi:MAG: 1-acyl-sn-glycerol-3-phosphate acyltransferase [Oscillospiraceae bacterium]|nr:1-acyl-sn-glycerol-3-phosphate acyltransferase [Oscillospiraceae bacterium]